MSGDNIVVAVKAAKEIPKTALVWALTHIVQPRDSVTLLALVASSSQARFCITRHRRSYSVANADEMSKINDSCSRMIRQLHGIYDPTKINVEIKIISDSPSGAVATEAKIAQANWVILDRQLKNEKKHCIEKLQSNVVVMKKSGPNVLRLSLVGSSARLLAQSSTSPLLTPSASPGTFSTAEVSDSNRGVSPLSINGTSKQAGRLLMRQNEFGSGSGSVSLSSSVRLKYQPWTREIFGSDENSSDLSSEVLSRSSRYSNLQEVIALSRKAPPGPPPLCSICQLKAPGFGQPPRWFTYAELELATAGFSNENFLAEGGYGSVHRGLLPDGLAIAVKQHKLASTQGDKQFSSEVEVLSRAQHRNVVMLIGFCIEDGRRLLVYEYICNGALDSHLYGQDKNPLSWSARQKIAVGAARGLRYLHEECRVGCIVHRDMRPNNILITHDFEPLVGDFGLARWQSDGQKGVDTRVLGTFGYLAPEYTESGQITEKADVYSFGVVLMELVSGLKAVDINRPRGQHCLSEWARPLLETESFGDLIDPRLGSRYLENEVYLMLHAASLCLRKDPHTRPRMSQVLRILEGEMIYESRRMNEQDQQVRCFLVTNDSPKMFLLNSPRTSTTDSPRLTTNLLLQSATDHHRIM